MIEESTNSQKVFEGNDELQNIMDEIDSLEQEFKGEETPNSTRVEPKLSESVESRPSPAPTPSTKAQSVEEPGETADKKERILPLKESEYSVSFNMDFETVGKRAELKICGREGLRLKVDNITFTVSQDGLGLKLAGGAAFAMPWEEKNGGVVKKAA